ncbi:aldehyde dehydrogenase family protein, partial [Candidatus Woesearchaeota archaeon]
VLSLEAGKPIKDARIEVDRAINTFRISSEEARRIEGEYIELDSMPAGKDRFAIIKRFPIGPIAAISPFNFPLNLVAHKLGPAIATGNPIVLKPASKTPLSALFLGSIILETEWPKDALSIVPCSRETGDKLVTDPRFAMLTFTGSPAVGWPMKERAGPKKKVVLELGGNAGVIIDRDANLDVAAQRVKAGGFGFAGQSCISVQRVYVHKEIEKEFTEKLLKEIEKIKIGNPLEEDTDLGPMIDEKAAKRTEEWVKEALDKGGELLTGGKAKGRIFEPTVLRNVKREAKICSEEAFAPVLVIETFTDFDEALEKVNDSVYGLQAGVFTNSQKNVWKAFEELDVGGVIINDVPTFRVDQMPYGGIKESGVGREGPRYAMEDMTEMKILVMRRDI